MGRWRRCDRDEKRLAAGLAVWESQTQVQFLHAAFMRPDFQDQLLDLLKKHHPRAHSDCAFTDDLLRIVDRELRRAYQLGWNAHAEEILDKYVACLADERRRWLERVKKVSSC